MARLIAEVEIFKLFLLVMVRFSGLMVSAPLLGSANFPVTGKIGLTALAAVLVTATLPRLEDAIPTDALGFSLLAAGEFLVGLAIGFVITIGLAAIQVAGQVMDMQTGFGMMNVFNPAMEMQFPIYGFFLFILAVLYLLVIDGHHMMIRGLVYSYEHIPVGGFVARPALMWEASRWGQAMFVDGFMIASPMVAAMLLAYLTMGMLGRVIPQLHLFVVGFPITISIGFILTAMMIGLYMHFLHGMFERMFQNADTLIQGMG